MGDLISREAVLEHYRVVDPQGTFVYCSSILEFIKNLPDAEPERKIGRLTKHEYFYGTSYYSCSECDNRMKIKENYCSHCGAKLVEADE